MRLRSYLLSLLFALASPSLVGAQDATPREAIAQIREQVLYANYQEAASALERYLERADLDAAGRNAGLEVRVTIQIASRQERRAQQTLAMLYARDPQHRLSESDPSPPVLSAFGRARENPPPPVEVTLDHSPPSLSARVPPTIEAEIVGDGASAVQELRLRYRQGGGPFSTVVMNVRDGRASSRIPLLDDPSEYDVEYFIEAAAPSGVVLASAGDDGDPLAFVVPEAPSGSAPSLGVASTTDGATLEDDEGGSLAWLWITLGVAVVAGGVAVAVVLASNSGPEEGSLGTVTLPLLSF